MSMSQLALISKNLQAHEEFAPRIRSTTLSGAVAEFTRTMERLGLAEDRLSRCSCGAAEPAFEINTRNTRLDFDFQLARMRRMAAEDAAIKAELFETESV